ncbi:MAG: hypothetical protein JNM42_00570, partial [Propionivibrio sp.]|uniref:beta strand repeat-containing protein n=1 Tax=Propionivibrio sp. TaxID=2212460 RepID=UPI001A46EB78
MSHLPKRLRVSALANAVSAAISGVHSSSHRLGLTHNTSRALLLPALFATLVGVAHAAPVSWVPDADGLWTTATNWSSNPSLPGSLDAVTIDVGGATVRTISFNSGSSGITSLTSEENLIFSGGTLSVSGAFVSGVINNTAATTISGGTLTLNGVSSLKTFTQSSGILNGTGAVTISGASIWTGGTMTGTGSSTFASSLDLSGPGLKDITNGRAVNFNGTTTWTTPSAGNGRIRTGSGVTLNNNGTWLDQNTVANQISNDFGGPASTFVNAGTYTKSGAGTTNIAIGFNNTTTGAGTGVVNINAGTLQLGGGGTSNGSFAGAGTLEFSGGTYTLQAGSSITNPNVVFSGGTTNLAGTYNASGTTTVSNGTANFTGTVVNSGGAFILSGGGTANFSNNAGVLFPSLNMQGGTISGTQAVTFTGPSSWGTGTMTGTGSTTFASDLALDTVGLKDITNGRTVNFNGTTTWTTPSAGNGRIRTGSGVTLNNNGTWLDQNTVSNQISNDFGGPASTFVNAGTYTKSGAGTTNIAIGFDNTSTGAGTGVVNINAGTLRLGGGGTSNGSFLGVGTLEFSGGTHNLQAASSIANPNVIFSGGTVNLAGAYNVSGATTVNGGTANFTGVLANSGGNLIISGGTANFSNTAGVQYNAL